MHSFAPLRGAGLDLPEDEGFLAAAHPGSALELLLLRPDWQVRGAHAVRLQCACALAWHAACRPARLPALRPSPQRYPCLCPAKCLPAALLCCLQEGWLGAEAWDAQRQLEGFLDAYAAWQPAGDQLRQLAAAAGEEDLLAPETPRSRCAAAAGASSRACAGSPARLAGCTRLLLMQAAHVCLAGQCRGPCRQPAAPFRLHPGVASPQGRRGVAPRVLAARVRGAGGGAGTRAGAPRRLAARARQPAALHAGACQGSSAVIWHA